MSQMKPDNNEQAGLNATEVLQNEPNNSHVDENDLPEVQFSNAENNSDIVPPERQLNARRRLLFDDSTEEPDDAEEENNVNLIIDELRQNAVDAKERWNFDFKNDVPLEGLWKWEPVDNPQS